MLVNVVVLFLVRLWWIVLLFRFKCLVRVCIVSLVLLCVF